MDGAEAEPIPEVCLPGRPPGTAGIASTVADPEIASEPARAHIHKLEVSKLIVKLISLWSYVDTHKY